MTKARLHVQVFDAKGKFAFSKLRIAKTKYQMHAYAELQQAMSFCDDLHGILIWFNGYVIGFPQYSTAKMEDSLKLNFNETYTSLTLYQHRYTPGLEDTPLMIIKNLVA